MPDDVLNSNLKEFIRRNAFYNALYDNAGLLNNDESGYEKVVAKCLENFDRVQKITFKSNKCAPQDTQKEIGIIIDL